LSFKKSDLKDFSDFFGSKIKAIMIVHKDGVPMAELISKKLPQNDPTLIAGALTSICHVIEEITGKGITSIATGDDYIHFLRTPYFNVVIMINERYAPIEPYLKIFEKRIISEYKEYLDNFDGEIGVIDLKKILKDSLGISFAIL